LKKRFDEMIWRKDLKLEGKIKYNLKGNFDENYLKKRFEEKIWENDWKLKKINLSFKGNFEEKIWRNDLRK